MHNRGSLTIDACLVTKLFIDALLGAWILPFGLLPSTIQEDLWMVGLDFDQDILFGNKLPMPAAPSTCGIYSNDMLAVCKFNDRVTEECKATQLFTQTQILYCKYIFTNEDHGKMENIDQLLTWILVTTNQKCCKNWDSPWSPTLHKIYPMHCYWKIWLSEARTKKDYSAALNHITDKLQSSLENSKTISANLCDLQQQLWEIQCTATLKWHEHLNSLLDAAHATNDTKWQKLILHLKCKEENWRCFKLHCQFMKPWSNGSLTKLQIPNPEQPSQWITITDPNRIDQKLLEYSQHHLANPTAPLSWYQHCPCYWTTMALPHLEQKYSMAQPT